MTQNHQKEQRPYALIDLQTGPYSLPESIRAEIQAIRKLGDSPEVAKAVNRLESWLINESYENVLDLPLERQRELAALEGMDLDRWVAITKKELAEDEAIFTQMREANKPPTESNQTCPICQTLVYKSERYPGYVCRQCTSKAADDQGKAITFYNKYIDGSGCQGYYNRPDSPYPHEHCFVDGVRCIARGAYMGGIVIQPEAFWDE